MGLKNKEAALCKHSMTGSSQIVSINSSMVKQAMNIKGSSKAGTPSWIREDPNVHE